MKLSNHGLLFSNSLHLDETCLLWVEHEYTADRLYRIHYDRVGAVVTYNTVPGGRLVIAGAVAVVGSLLLLAANHPAPVYIGVALIVIGLVLVVWNTVCGRTHILVERDGNWSTYQAIATPKRMQAFLDEFYARIRAAQPQESPASEPPTASVPPPDHELPGTSTSDKGLADREPLRDD